MQKTWNGRKQFSFWFYILLRFYNDLHKLINVIEDYLDTVLSRKNVTLYMLDKALAAYKKNYPEGGTYIGYKIRDRISDLKSFGHE